MHKLACLAILLLVSFASCSHRKEEQRKENSVEANSQEAPRKPSQGYSAIVPALEEAVFIDADNALVFPGYFEGVADEEVVNNDRVPMVTRDGGESWNSLSSKTLKFTSISFLDLSLGWLVNQDSELWKTTDGGASWAFVSKVEVREETLSLSQEIKFIDELNGWVLDLDSLWRTTDGGQTWSHHEFPSLVAKFFVRGDSAWVASQYQSEQNNVIYKTRDAGKSWDDIELPNTVPSLLDSIDTKDLFFADKQTGWLADTRGVYRTDDGGNTWKKQRLPRRNLDIQSLCFINEQEGWAAGWKVVNERENKFEAILLHTMNRGDIWQQVDIGVKQTFFDKVYFADSQNGWLVAKEADEGDDFFIQNANIYRTRDGGITWKKVLSVKSPYPSAKGSEQ